MMTLISKLGSILPLAGYWLIVLTLVGCSTTPITDNSASLAPQSSPVLLAQAGIGGTGIQLNQAEGHSKLDGGMGGTGSKLAQDGGMGGTGIVGALTKIAGHLRIDDIEISYDEDMPVTLNGKSKKIDDLLVGQIAVIQAQKTGNQITAQNISIIHAVVGPVQQINEDDRTLTVLDQTIRMHKDIPMDVFETGKWVRVSGYRTGKNTVMATRVDRIMEHLNHDVAAIHGNVTQVLANNEYLVNGTHVIMDHPAQITVGTEVSVQGKWQDNHLVTKQARLNPTQALMGAVSNIVVEGFWDTIHNNWQVDFESFRISKPDVAGTVESLEKNEMVTVYGALNTAQQIVVSALNIQEIIELESGYEFDIFDDLLTDNYAENMDVLDEIDNISIDSIEMTGATGSFSALSEMEPISVVP